MKGTVFFTNGGQQICDSLNFTDNSAGVEVRTHYGVSFYPWHIIECLDLEES